MNTWWTMLRGGPPGGQSQTGWLASWGMFQILELSRYHGSMGVSGQWSQGRLWMAPMCPGGRTGWHRTAGGDFPVTPGMAQRGSVDRRLRYSCCFVIIRQAGGLACAFPPTVGSTPHTSLHSGPHACVTGLEKVGRQLREAGGSLGSIPTSGN